jgi:hypothetical protein
MWQKLLSREGVDVTTISQVDVVYYDMIWNFTQNREELLFSIVKGKNLTHYIGLDPNEFGRQIYKKHFNNPKQIEKYYRRGKKLLNEINQSSKKWSTILTENPTSENLFSAFSEFRHSFEEICYIYSIISWSGIEAWQSDFEKSLNDMIVRNHQEKQAEKIIASAYHPWKKTALIEIQEKLLRGVSAEQLSEEYQFLRSWCVVWFRPLTKEWIQSIKPDPASKKQFLLSKKELFNLLKPTNSEKENVELAPYMVFFKDWRDDVRRYHAFHWSFLFDALAAFFSASRDELGYLSLNEFEEAIQTGSFPQRLIEQRKKDGCLVTAQGDGLKMHVLTGPTPQKYLEIIEMV